MPTIICSWCDYIGQGEDYDARIADVEVHEETCLQRPSPEEEESEL